MLSFRWVVGAFTGISAYSTVYEIVCNIFVHGAYTDTQTSIYQLAEEGMDDVIRKMKSIWDMPGEIDDQLLKHQVMLGQDIKFPVSK